MSSQNWLLRYLTLKPLARSIPFVVPDVEARSAIIAVWKSWECYGFSIFVDDEERLLMKATVGRKNPLKLKEVVIVAEVRAISDTQALGRRGRWGVARFTAEKGDTSSFDRILDEMVKVFGQQGLLAYGHSLLPS